ncbi:unnamed protein product [Didymodactylos carnosus]|uniref:Uncharacterized protein n=1 Tax=Didymodactylos carnosus TaxID=1234261 RepID=A0A8S2UKY3_9BILA|nr:unnamed protein product [Didymodactylos carnosus]CAF4343538.1 unnamed protein product [Didymodactylos carnosus]
MMYIFSRRYFYLFYYTVVSFLFLSIDVIMAETKRTTGLSEEKFAEFQNYYGVMPKPMCQKCGTNDNVIPSVRGKPSQELAMYAEEGYVKLSGCTTTHTGWCKKCEQWTG